MILWAWEVEAAVSHDHATALQPEQESETPSRKKKKLQLIFHLILTNPPELRCYHNPILTMEKQRTRQCKHLAQGHTAKKW